MQSDGIDKTDNALPRPEPYISNLYGVFADTDSSLVSVILFVALLSIQERVRWPLNNMLSEAVRWIGANSNQIHFLYIGIEIPLHTIRVHRPWLPVRDVCEMRTQLSVLVRHSTLSTAYNKLSSHAICSSSCIVCMAVNSANSLHIQYSMHRHCALTDVIPTSIMTRNCIFRIFQWIFYVPAICDKWRKFCAKYILSVCVCVWCRMRMTSDYHFRMQSLMCTQWTRAAGSSMRLHSHTHISQSFPLNRLTSMFTRWPH